MDTTDTGQERQERRIVVGVDGSQRSLEAVEWAAPESVTRGVSLAICHVMPSGSWGGVSRQERRRYSQHLVSAAAAHARETAPAVRVREVISEGHPAEELVSAAAGAEALVLGARGAGGFSALLLGAVSEQVAAHGQCPVVIVRGSRREGPILVGVDASPESRAALGFAFHRASLLGLQVRALHTYELVVAVPSFGFVPDMSIEDIHDTAQKTLDEAVAPWEERYPNVPVTRQLLQDRAAGALVRESADSGLVVVGSRGHGGFTGLLLGSVSRHVLRHAECPVAVLRG